MASTSPTVRLRPLPTPDPAEIEDALVVEHHEPTRFVRARVFALSMLVLILGAISYGGYSAFRAFTDSFIAPMTLSPSSELVLSSKLKLDDLARERAQTAADLQRIGTEIQANAEAVRRLRELQGKFQSAVTWMGTMNTHKSRLGVAELSAVNAQGQIAKTMLEEQKRQTQKAEVDLSAGLITRMDYAKEMQRLSELQRGMIDNERSRLQGQSNLYELQAADQALKAKKDVPMGPQLLASQEQLVRVELEIQRLESEMRVKSALRDAALTRFGEVDLLAEQLRARPLFRAVNRKLDMAFVPYSQLDGVAPRAEIYACGWGMFFCKPVGRVTEILEGEVTQTDPWGTPARGLYAILNLTDPTAARAKTLRVRVGSVVRPKRRALATPMPGITAR